MKRFNPSNLMEYENALIHFNIIFNIVKSVPLCFNHIKEVFK